MNKYPMLVNSVFKDYLWGGTRLRDEYGKQTELDPVAESWELSCHRDGPATVANGEYAGMVLADYVAMDRASVLGAGWAGEEDFPILVKFIDAKNPLSVQVHPDDAYAKVAENDHGKAEVWLVLAAEPGASLVYGVNREWAQTASPERCTLKRLWTWQSFTPPPFPPSPAISAAARTGRRPSLPAVSTSPCAALSWTAAWRLPPTRKASRALPVSRVSAALCSMAASLN